MDSPFTVLVDTREQAPYRFQNLQSNVDRGNKLILVPIERVALPTGDYSILGLHHKVAVERKEKGDLFHCMGKDRSRFEKQVERLNEIESGFLVTECNIASILAGHPNSQMNPRAIVRTIISWQFKYPRVHWWLMPTRARAEAITYRILEKAWSNEQKR